MDRRNAFKILDCIGCGKPVSAGAEASRAMCSECVLLGKAFPRDEQLELIPDESGAAEDEKGKRIPKK